MNLQLAIALFKLITALVRFFEEQRWYQDGRNAANAEANAEQEARIKLANAARADAEHIAAGGVPVDDPHARD